MADRTVTLGMVFEADLSKAKAQVDAFIADLKSRSASIPFSANAVGSGGAGTPTTSTTIGGLSTTLAASPGSVASSGSQFGREVAQAFNASLAQIMARTQSLIPQNISPSGSSPAYLNIPSAAANP